MDKQKVARELVKIAKSLMSVKNMYVEVSLNGSPETVKRVPVPSGISKDTVKRNEFARQYFQDLGYKKVQVGRWS